MLVLPRKAGASIVIDGGVTVRVAACQGGKIRLAIEAPRDVLVPRDGFLGDGDFATTGRHPRGKDSLPASALAIGHFARPPARANCAREVEEIQ